MWVLQIWRNSLNASGSVSCDRSLHVQQCLVVGAASPSKGGFARRLPGEIPLDVAVSGVMPHPDGRLLLEVDPGAPEYVNVLRDWQAMGGGGG